MMQHFRIKSLKQEIERCNYLEDEFYFPRAEKIDK